MASGPPAPLDESDLESITAETADETAVRAALSSSDPLIRHRGTRACERLAKEDVDAVEPFLDSVASLVDDEYAPVALSSIAVFDHVSRTRPSALEERLDSLVRALDTDIVEVQSSGASVLATIVVEQPAMLAPYVRPLLDAIGATEPSREAERSPNAISDRATRETIDRHLQNQRDRLVSSRRTLANVVVAIAETNPKAAFDAVSTLETRTEDIDPMVAGCAVDALAELAAVDPGRVASASDTVLERLDHDRAVVRARAVRALGYLNLGDRSVVDSLRTVAETDSDEAVRDLARETAAFLAESS